MLQKTNCTVEQARFLPEDQAIIIKVETEEDLKESMLVFEKRKSLRGIQIQSFLLQKLPKNHNINFFSIILEKAENLELIKQHCNSKQQFVELIIQYNLCTDSLLKKLEGIKRVIVDFTNENTGQITQEKIKQLLAILISNKFFPFTKGLDQNKVEEKHMVEFYCGKLKKENFLDSSVHASSAKRFIDERNEGDLL